MLAILEELTGIIFGSHMFAVQDLQIESWFWDPQGDTTKDLKGSR